MAIVINIDDATIEQLAEVVKEMGPLVRRQLAAISEDRRFMLRTQRFTPPVDTATGYLPSIAMLADGTVYRGKKRD